MMAVNSPFAMVRDVVQGGHLIVPFAVSFAQILDFQKFHTVDLLCWNLSLS